MALTRAAAVDSLSLNGGHYLTKGQVNTAFL
jgi:hypothetical protein